MEGILPILIDRGAPTTLSRDFDCLLTIKSEAHHNLAKTQTARAHYRRLRSPPMSVAHHDEIGGRRGSAAQ
jgi:hypothetical protein